MTKREKKIAKYVSMLNDLKKKCMAGEEISVGSFCKSHNAGHMSVKAAQHFGYVKKIGVRKFKWMVAGDVTPIMAKCITDWNFKYKLDSVNKSRTVDNNVTIVGDVNNDCEVTKLKYQAMLDHQKIVDLETSIKNCELALKNAKMDTNNAKDLAKENEDSLVWVIDQKDKHIENLAIKVENLSEKLKSASDQLNIVADIMSEVPTVTYYLFGIPVWKRKEKVSR